MSFNFEGGASREDDPLEIILSPEDAEYSDRLLSNHMEEFDDYVDAAVTFVHDKLGMSDAIKPDKIAVLPTRIAEQWQSTESGKYLPELDIAFVFESKDNGRPKTEKLQLATNLVHEIAHSASTTAELAQSEHSFFNEGIAGLAEYFALQNLAEAGEYEPAPDIEILRIIDDKEIKLIIPGSFRKVDAHETIDGEAETTQALIAAMVIGLAMKKSGKKATEILSQTRRGDIQVFAELKEVVEKIEPGFVHFIESQPDTTDGIIKIAERAQKLIGVI